MEPSYGQISADLAQIIAAEEEVEEESSKNNESFSSNQYSHDFGHVAAEEEIRLKDCIPPVKKKRKSGPATRRRQPIVIRCSHEPGNHYTRNQIEEGLNMNKVSIIMNPPKGSIIWSFCGFPEIDDHICAAWLVCTVCKNVFAFGESAPSSGAKRHIEKKHGDLLADVLKSLAEDDSEQIIVADCGTSAPPMRIVSGDGSCVKKRPAANSKRNDYETTVYDEHGEPIQAVYDDFEDTLDIEVDSIPVERSRFRTPGSKSRRLVVAPSTQNHPSTSATVCTHCNVDFKNFALSMMHRSCHGLGGKFQCAQCGLAMTNMFDFWGHLYSRVCH